MPTPCSFCQLDPCRVDRTKERRRERMDESQTQNRSFLAGKLVSELQAIAEQVGVKDPKKRKKAELIDAILGIAPQPLSSHATPPAGNGAAAATVNGVRHDEAVRESTDNGGSEARASGPWAGRGPDQPDQSEPHRGPDAPTAEASGSSVHEEPSSQPAAVAIPAGASAAPAETVPAPPGSNGSTHGPSVGREYETPRPEAAQPNGDAPAPTATAEDSAEGSTDTSTAASPEASTQAPPQGPPDARPEYRREGEGVRERDRGRRRRRRERGGDRPERPGDRQERPDRGNERQDRGGPDRMDRPRRETESEDTGELEVRTGVLDVLP